MTQDNPIPPAPISAKDAEQDIELQRQAFYDQVQDGVVRRGFEHQDIERGKLEGRIAGLEKRADENWAAHTLLKGEVDVMRSDVAPLVRVRRTGRDFVVALLDLLRFPAEARNEVES